MLQSAQTKFSVSSRDHLVRRLLNLTPEDVEVLPLEVPLEPIPSSRSMIRTLLQEPVRPHFGYSGRNELLASVEPSSTTTYVKSPTTLRNSVTTSPRYFQSPESVLRSVVTQLQSEKTTGTFNVVGRLKSTVAGTVDFVVNDSLGSTILNVGSSVLVDMGLQYAGLDSSLFSTSIMASGLNALLVTGIHTVPKVLRGESVPAKTLVKQVTLSLSSTLIQQPFQGTSGGYEFLGIFAGVLINDLVVAGTLDVILMLPKGTKATLTSVASVPAAPAPASSPGFSDGNQLRPLGTTNYMSLDGAKRVGYVSRQLRPWYRDIRRSIPRVLRHSWAGISVILTVMLLKDTQGVVGMFVQRNWASVLKSFGFSQRLHKAIVARVLAMSYDFVMSNRVKSITTWVVETFGSDANLLSPYITQLTRIHLSTKMILQFLKWNIDATTKAAMIYYGQKHAGDIRNAVVQIGPDSVDWTQTLRRVFRKKQSVPPMENSVDTLADAIADTEMRLPDARTPLDFSSQVIDRQIPGINRLAVRRTERDQVSEASVHKWNSKVQEQIARREQNAETVAKRRTERARESETSVHEWNQKTRGLRDKMIRFETIKQERDRQSADRIHSWNTHVLPRVLRKNQHQMKQDKYIAERKTDRDRKSTRELDLTNRVREIVQSKYGTKAYSTFVRDNPLVAKAALATTKYKGIGIQVATEVASAKIATMAASVGAVSPETLEIMTGFRILKKLGTAMDVASILTTGHSSNEIVETTAANFHYLLDPTLVELDTVSTMIEQTLTSDVQQVIEEKIHELTNIQYFEEDAVRTAMGLMGVLGESKLDITMGALLGREFTNDIKKIANGG